MHIRTFPRTTLALALALVMSVLMAGQSLAAVAWPVLGAGAGGEDVITLQAMLRAANYTVIYNGSFDTTTQNAVRQYQTNNGLTVTGTTTAQTWESLTSRSTSVVRLNVNGLVSEALQRQLKNSYGYNLVIDGQFGGGTDSKVKSFQKSVNLSADGVVGRNTWFHIISGDTARIRHSSAMTQLSNAGITVTSSSGAAGVFADRVEAKTSLEQIRQQSISGLIGFKNRLPAGCPVVVTGGTETWIHQGGVPSHHTGYKIDIRPDACVSNYIKTNFTSLGNSLWRDANGYVYFDEAPGTLNHHWDIRF